jgi:hypothetical protein
MPGMPDILQGKMKTVPGLLILVLLASFCKTAATLACSGQPGRATVMLLAWLSVPAKHSRRFCNMADRPATTKLTTRNERRLAREKMIAEKSLNGVVAQAFVISVIYVALIFALNQIADDTETLYTQAVRGSVFFLAMLLIGLVERWYYKKKHGGNRGK